MSKERPYVFAAYCVANSLADVTPEQARKLTHLNLAFGVVKENKINIDAIRENRFYLDEIRSWNPDLVITLSTGGGGAGGHGEATRPENLEGFVQSTMDAVRELGLDGIDCDWEFPCNTGHMEEKAQHVALMKAYRRELDIYEKERGRKCWLTIAAAAWDKYLRNTDVVAVAEVLDFINIMTYDIRDAAWAETTPAIIATYIRLRTASTPTACRVAWRSITRWAFRMTSWSWARRSIPIAGTACRMSTTA